MSDDLPAALTRFGAQPNQLVDLAGEPTARSLSYIDLIRTPPPGRAPVVFEVHGQARAFLFDSRGPNAPGHLKQWIRRVAFRSDADWVGVISPGKLDVYRAALDAAEPAVTTGIPEGAFRLPSLLHRVPEATNSIRFRLLQLLRKSIDELRREGVEAADALSLVGRALFWRFLIDRGLLEGLKPQSIAVGAKSFDACLDDGKRADSTFAWLERIFNGELLPMRRSVRGLGESAFRIIGNIAHAATAAGQLPLRLPHDWSEVNFAHVPVGLLSEVYEAYAHSEDSARARAESIFYTPRHIAEFVVAEALDAIDERASPRVLDPSAGAGVFLVSAFRHLVAHEWKRAGRRPSRKVVRRILNEQLTGFDINGSALRLAQLALYLTAIELDPELKPWPLEVLRFDALDGAVLFHKTGGLDSGSLGPTEKQFREKFDLVVGNPPWTSTTATAKAKARWEDDSRPIVAARLDKERARTFAFPDGNPDLPFLYRAMEWARKGGQIALITHGRWLFGQTPKVVQARRDLLESLHVTGALNGASLRDTNVWPNVRHPFCVMFAKNERRPEGSEFQLVSPKLDTSPDAAQQRLRIDWADAQTLNVDEVLKSPWIPKARYRGTPLDEGVLRAMLGIGVPLGPYLKSIGARRLSNGYQVGGKAGRHVSSKHLHDLPDLRGTVPGFFVKVDDLKKFTRPTLLRPRTRDIYRAPLLLVHESVLVDPLAPRAMVSRFDVAFDERFDGASFKGVTNAMDVAAYLQLVVQSSTFKHALLMTDGQFGIERELVHLATINAVPVVPFAQLSAAARARAAMLSARLENEVTVELMRDIDAFAADVYRLDDVQRDAIADTLSTAVPTAAAKSRAVQRTTREERQLFVETCHQELNHVLAASKSKADVRLLDDVPEGPWQLLRISSVEGAADSVGEQISIDAFLDAADEGSASLVDVHIGPRESIVGILDQYQYWTRTRARLLAMMCLAEGSQRAA